MKVSLHNKYIRFLLIESHFRTRLILITILAGLAFLLISINFKQERLLTIAKGHAKLVWRIPDMEDALRNKKHSLAELHQQQQNELDRIEEEKLKELARLEEERMKELAANMIIEVVPDSGPTVTELKAFPKVQGVVNMEDDEIAVLIDGEIFEVLDMIGSYRIDAITSSSLSLTNIKTQQVKVHRFSTKKEPLVFIDGKIYEEKENIGDYSIIQILDNEVVFKNKTTAEIIKVGFTTQDL